MRAVSLHAAVAGVGATLGLVASGMFAGWLCLRVRVFINAPIGLALALAAPRRAARYDPASRSPCTGRARPVAVAAVAAP